MLGAILVVVALVLAVVDIFAVRTNRRTPYLLHASVILVCIALLLGVSALVSVKG